MTSSSWPPATGVRHTAQGAEETRQRCTITHVPGGPLRMHVMIPLLRELAYVLLFACDLGLRLSGERHHEKAEGEGDEESDTAARHGSLLRSRTCGKLGGGMLRAACQRGNSNVADAIVHIRGDDSRIYHVVMRDECL